jgi:hypothetical protein
VLNMGFLCLPSSHLADLVLYSDRFTSLDNEAAQADVDLVLQLGQLWCPGLEGGMHDYVVLVMSVQRILGR